MDKAVRSSPHRRIVSYELVEVVITRIEQPCLFSFVLGDISPASTCDARDPCDRTLSVYEGALLFIRRACCVRRALPFLVLDSNVRLDRDWRIQRAQESCDRGINVGAKTFCVHE